MFPESELLPLSALQHLAFCERQCALIHLEQQWEENRLTAEGRQLHERVDEPAVENRGDLRVVRALKLRSLRLGISGQADVIEFHRVADAAPGAVAVEGAHGRWRVHPVEYKRGKPKANRCDEIQMCAQALCLEEMMPGAHIAEGALFYGTPRRRTVVSLDEALRALTERLCRRLHQLIAQGVTPRAEYERKCDSCSLLEVCQPRLLGARAPSRYLAALLKDASAMEAGDEAPP